MGMAPTNKSFAVEGYDEVLFKNGKAVEHWGMTDQASLMRQLGMLPAAAQNQTSSSPAAAKPAPGANGKY
jgi:hypothetical protein